MTKDALSRVTSKTARSRSERQPTLLAQLGVTRREAEVLAALAERLTNAEIAGRLYVSERTAEAHVSSLLRKLGAANRLELSEIAKEALAGPRSLLPGALELLADPSRYVGRAEELARLRDLWRRAADGRMLVGVVAGEAGIGKSRLVAELAAEAHDAGGMVLLGSCFEEAGIPYQPFAQAIGDDVAALSDIEFRRRVGTDTEALSRVIPEVAKRALVAVSSDIPDPIFAQGEAAAAMCGYFTRSAESAPILCVIEDVHWATATTLATLRHLARASARARVLLLMTTRDTAPDLHDDLKVFLGDLARLPTVESIELSGLPEDDVASLLHALGSTVDPVSVLAETGGNPLFVKEVARSSDGKTGSLSGLLASRYGLLADDDLAILDVAAVIGSEFQADLVARAVDRELPEVLESLERAESAGLVEATPGRPGRFSFVHALFRRARYDSVPGARRLRLHHGVAAGLEALLPRNEHVLPELARHACIAAPVGDARRAVEHAVAAAALAERALALEEAAGHCRRALEVAEALDEPDDKLVLALTTRLGELLTGAGDPQARGLLMRAAATARVTGDAKALAEVAWALIRHGGRREPGADLEFVGIVEDALAWLGPARTAVRARTLGALSEELSYTDPARALELAHEAIAIAEDLDDPLTLGHVLLSYRFSGTAPENTGGGRPTADRLIAIGRQTGHAPFVFLGLVHRAWSARGAGDLKAADRAMETAAALLGDHPTPFFAAIFAQYRSAQRLMAGDLEGAEETANEILELGPGIEMLTMYGPTLVMIRTSQYRLHELIPLIETAVDSPGLGTAYQAALAVAYAFDGRHEDARRILGRFAGEAFRGVPRNMLWLTSMVCFGESAEVAGDAFAAAAIGTELEGYSGRIADLPVAVISTVDLCLAQTALTAGDHERAETFAGKAVAASRHRKTAIYLGRELIRLAAARRGLGRPQKEIDGLVDEALAISDRTGAHIIRRDAERYRLA